MEVKVFAALITTAMIIFAVAVWMHEYRCYKSDKGKPVKAKESLKSVLVCNSKKCEHYANGTCDMSVVEIYEDGQCACRSVPDIHIDAKA